MSVNLTSKTTATVSPLEARSVILLGGIGLVVVGLGSTRGLSVRQLLDRGELVAAARREADAAERDGYDVTADLLRQLADAVEGKSHV